MSALTKKQETFCQAYVEGKTASDAYRTAYDAQNMASGTIWTEASLLLDNPKVSKRVEELRAPAVEAVRLNLAEHLNDLKALRDKADSDAKYGPAIQAEIARGKASGLYKETIEHTGANGGPIQTLTINLDASKLSPDVREQLRMALLETEE